MRLQVWMIPALGAAMLLALIVLFEAQKPELYLASPANSLSAASSTFNAPASVSSPTSTPATSTKPTATKKSLPAKQKIAVAPSQSPAPSSALIQQELDFASANLRASLVNIICTSSTNAFNSISGSGVLIDPKGIILTNAHIAMYFLFQGDSQYPVSCVIRRGSPAQTAYRAKLVFISPAWVKQNANVLGQAHPVGNGEHDLALVAITESATSAPLPDSFPALALGNADPYTGEPVVIGAYGAQFLSTEEIVDTLFPTIVFGSVQTLYTFDTTTADVFSVGGSAAAQQGSSGGGVVDAHGNLVGTIVTSTVGSDTADRSLAAISSGYVARDYLSEMGTSLAAALDNSPQTLVDNFADEATALKSLLISALGSR